MTQETLNLYEGMYIISATLSDDARKKAVDKIIKGITDAGGEAHKLHDLGRRKLAYDINGKKEGHYYVLFFSLKPSLMKDQWKEYHLHEDLMRFMTLKAEKVEEELKFGAEPPVGEK